MPSSIVYNSAITLGTVQLLDRGIEDPMVFISSALLLVTAIYAWLTYGIAKETRIAAEASRESADSARVAAEASLRSALVAEAGLAVEFEVLITRHINGEAWFNLTSSVNVWAKAIRIRGAVLVEEGGGVTPYEAHLRLPSMEGSFPLYVHAGQAFSVEWPEPRYRVGDYGIFGHLIIEYSLNKDGETRRREVYFESPKGMEKDLRRRAGMYSGDEGYKTVEGTPSEG